MSSFVPSPMISSMDTYYMYVLKQMAQVNQSRVASMLGMAEAQDWPQMQVTDGGIYLLHLGSTPIKRGQSTTMFKLYEHTLQWVWILIGTDIQPGQQAASRGDRYRASLSLFNDLVQASYPGFCSKAVISEATDGTVSANITNPLEMVRWNDLSLRKKETIDSGVIYGVVPVEVQGYEQIDPAVDAALAFPPVPA